MAAETHSSAYKAQQALAIQKQNPDLLRDVARGGLKLRDAIKRIGTGNNGSLSGKGSPKITAEAREHVRRGDDGSAGQTSEDSSATGQALANRAVQAVRTIIDCLPHKSAVAAYVKALAALTATVSASGGQRSASRLTRSR